MGTDGQDPTNTVEPGAAAATAGAEPSLKSGSKRPAQQKTPEQKEALEKLFQENNLPNEAAKRALSESIKLTIDQISTWFNHRRRREKQLKAAAANGGDVNVNADVTAPVNGAAAPATNTSPAENTDKKPKKKPSPAKANLPNPTNIPSTSNAAPAPASGPAAAILKNQNQPIKLKSAAVQEESEGHDDVDSATLDPAQAARLQEYKEILLAARESLEEPYRVDGPPLGFEFDDVPAISLPRGGSGKGTKRRKTSEDDPDFDLHAGGGGNKRGRTTTGGGSGSLTGLLEDGGHMSALITARAREQVVQLEAAIKREYEKLERFKEKEDAKLVKEREREIARLEVEHRRHLERVLREQRKDEERRLKEEIRMQALQEKEEKRLALVRERELKAEEKRLEKEEKKRERDALRALNQQGRQAMRLRERAPSSRWSGPKDDADIEWDVLMEEYRQRTGLPSEIPAPIEGAPAPEGYPPLPTRPAFPPPEKVEMPPALVLSSTATTTATITGEVKAEVNVGDVDQANGVITSHIAGSLLSSWVSLSTFSPILGITCPTLDELVAALATGISSKILSQVHIGILRLLQADAEEAFALGEGHLAAEAKAAAAAAAAGAAHVHIITPGAMLLEEAAAWGFDVNSWRAHLHALTWPEIARELATAAGLGRRRPQIRRREELARMGREGEDIVSNSKNADPNSIELKLPSRLATGTVKGAAWLVLKDAGHEGLHVEEIARRIQQQGHRDLRTSKNPETSVSGSLARDVLFERVAPATFALQSLRAHHRRSLQGEEGENNNGGDGSGGGDAAAVKKEEEGEQDQQKDAANKSGVKKEGRLPTPPIEGQKEEGKEEDGGKADDVKQEGEVEEEEEEEEEEESENEEEEEERRRRDEAHVGESWVAALRDGDYGSLPLSERVAMLSSLCQLALESPTVREILDRRLDEQAKIRRQTWEDAKNEAALHRQKKQAAEQAAKERAEAAAAAAAAAAAQPADGAAPMEIEGQQPQDPPPPNGTVAATVTATTVGNLIAQDPEAAAEIAAENKAAALARQARAEAALRGMEANAVRVEPLGTDRRFNKYWRLVRDNSNNIRNNNDGAGASVDGGDEDAGSGRIFVESQEDGSLRVICTEESLVALMGSLDRRGPREKLLFSNLQKYKNSLIAAMPAAPLTPAPSRSEIVGSAVSLSELQALSPLSSLEASSSLPENSKRMSLVKPFLNNEPAAMTVLKGDFLSVEYAIPEEDLNEEFDRDEWRAAVEAAKTPIQLRRCLGQLENALEATALDSAFNKEPLLVKGAWIPIGEEVATAMPGSSALEMILPMSPTAGGCAGGSLKWQTTENKDGGDDDNSDDATTEPLAWLPPTIGAISLRLASLDASLKYGNDSAARESLLGYHHILRPGRLPYFYGKKRESSSISDGTGANAGTATATATASEERMGKSTTTLAAIFPGASVLLGPALDGYGRVKPVLFPSFPYRLLFTPRVDFTFDAEKFQQHIAINSDEPLTTPGTGAVGGGKGSRGGAVGVGGGSRYRGGRPKGSKNKAINRLSVPGAAIGGGSAGAKQRVPSAAGGSGAAGGGGGGASAGGKKRAGGPTTGHRSALGRELGARSDSDKHYGSEYEDEERREEREYMSGMLLHSSAQGQYTGSEDPSRAGTAGVSLEEEEIDDLGEEEEEEEEGEPEEGAPVDEYQPSEDEEAPSEEDEELEEVASEEEEEAEVDDEDSAEEESDIDIEESE